MWAGSGQGVQREEKWINSSLAVINMFIGSKIWLKTISVVWKEMIESRKWEEKFSELIFYLLNVNHSPVSMFIHFLLLSLCGKVSLAAKHCFELPFELFYKARNGSFVKVVKKETNACHKKPFFFLWVLKASKPPVILNNLRKYT